MSTIETENSPVTRSVETQEFLSAYQMGEVSLAAGLLVTAYVESGNVRTVLAVASGLLMSHVTLGNK